MGRGGNGRGDPVPRRGARTVSGSWRVLGTAPWRRAPLLLRRQPAVLSAVLFSGLILGAASAAVPLFESSVASAANAKQVAQRCPATVGFMLTTADVLSGRIGGNDAPGATGLAATMLLERRQTAVERAGARVPGTGQPRLTISGAPLIMSNPGDSGRSANGRLLYREGFTDNIQKLQAAGGSGVWLPSETARFAGVRAGGRVALTINDRRVVTRVAGVYKDLNRLPVTPFWCPQGSLIYAAGLGREIPPPPILADRDTLAALDRQLQQDRLQFTWELPLRGNLTLPQSRRTAAGLDTLRSLLGAGPGAVFRLRSGQALFSKDRKSVV